MSHDIETDAGRELPDAVPTDRREPVRAGPGWAWTCHLWRTVEDGQTPCYAGDDGYLTRWGARRAQSRHLHAHTLEAPVATRIRATDVGALLADAGFTQSEWDPADCTSARDCWEPGYRAVQQGPRLVHVVHDGPREADYITRYTQQLRAAGYHVQLERPQIRGRYRLAVTHH